jgi:hypothetical protein
MTQNATALEGFFFFFLSVCVCAYVCVCMFFLFFFLNFFVLAGESRGKGGQLMLWGILFQWSSVCSKLWRPRPPNLPHHHPLPSSRLLLLSLTNPVFSDENKQKKNLIINKFRKKLFHECYTSLSSSSIVNSFFFTCLSWLRKLNSAAFFCSLANLFSYLETLRRDGLILNARENTKIQKKNSR